MQTRTRLLLMLAFSALSFPACQQKMAHQPYYRPYDPTESFPGNISARPLEAGVVPRGRPLEFHPLMTGLTLAAWREHPELASVPKDPDKKDDTPAGSAGMGAPLLGAPNDPEKFVSAFPWKISAEDLKRGQQRYQIFCVECHGTLGDGRGKIVERGFLAPPSYHTDNSRGFGRWQKQIALRDVPVGYIFQVITQGYGGMPDHAAQIPPIDRWKIVAYVKALQLSQNAKLTDLPEKVRKVAEAELEKTGGKK